MPATKKKASKKKTSAKKKSAKKTSIAAGRVNLEFPLDANKIEAIKRCLDRGRLRVTINRVDLLRGRLRDPWLYD